MEHGAWWSMIPEQDRARYEHAGFGVPQELGERPAVLVIDVTKGFVGTAGLSEEEAIDEYRTSCGPAAWAALPAIQRTVVAARSVGIPVVYTRGRPPSTRSDLGGWVAKNRRASEDLQRGEEMHQIVEEVAPRPGDLVLAKEKPSAFFGTPLIARLTAERVDSVVVTGCTTSGCVRATVVDAFSTGLGVTVLEDAVFDRGELSHAVNLFDMQAKYAQVAPVDWIMERW